MHPSLNQTRYNYIVEIPKGNNEYLRYELNTTRQFNKNDKVFIKACNKEGVIVKKLTYQTWSKNYYWGRRIPKMA